MGIVHLLDMIYCKHVCLHLVILYFVFMYPSQLTSQHIHNNQCLSIYVIGTTLLSYHFFKRSANNNKYWRLRSEIILTHKSIHGIIGFGNFLDVAFWFRCILFPSKLNSAQTFPIKRNQLVDLHLIWFSLWYKCMSTMELSFSNAVT